MESAGAPISRCTYNKRKFPKSVAGWSSPFAQRYGKSSSRMSTRYEDEKISAHDATAQLSEHRTKPGGIAANLSPEKRMQVEKSLKRKLDARCSLFVLIYIMNCKQPFAFLKPNTHTQPIRSRPKQHCRSTSGWARRRPRP